MGTHIHPTAVVDPGAEIGCDVAIGPFCVIDSNVVIGDRCRLSSHVSVKEGTTIGDDNDVSEGAILGGKPQHLMHTDGFGRLLIGCANTIRENVTLHRGLKESSHTMIGDHNLLMVNVHVAHDCLIGNHTIIANNVVMAGHVAIGDYAYLSGAVGIHQFCRIGNYAMVGGQAHVKKDIPPYVTVDGQSTRIVGLNVVGLRRRGFDATTLQQLKAAYRVIYRSGLKWTEVLEALRAQFSDGPATAFHAFFLGGQRGFLPERRTPSGAMVRVPQLDAESLEQEKAPQLRRLAG